MAAMTAIAIVLQSKKVCPARLIMTDAINPMALMFIASRKAAIVPDFRRRGINGFNAKTNRNEGRNTATVAMNAPGTPAMTYPTKVAVLRSGPGVNWPIAIASRSC